MERTIEITDLVPNPFQCAQLDAARLNGELARGQRQVLDVQRT